MELMKLICESGQLTDYLSEQKEVDYSNPIIKEKREDLFNSAQTEIEKTKAAFNLCIKIYIYVLLYT